MMSRFHITSVTIGLINVMQIFLLVYVTINLEVINPLYAYYFYW